MTNFSAARVRNVNNRPVNPAGQYVLYWCQMYRRLTHNHALDHAIALARELKKPLIVYEGLKLTYPWASARMHRFLLDGMKESVTTAARMGITYWPFVETLENDGRGLVRKLCASACALITDDYPQFIVPAQTQAIANCIDIAAVAVDGNSLVPLSLLGPPTAAAAHLRPKIHKLFATAWAHRANAEPDIAGLPKAPKPPFELWQPPAKLDEYVNSLPVDQCVPAVPSMHGGATAGRQQLSNFIEHKLPRYAEGRNGPDDPAMTAASGLSAHLRHGHIAIQEVAEAVLGSDWTPDDINPKTRNKDDFFCRDANVNGYLDEAITWRDVGYQWNFARLTSQPRSPKISTANDSHSPAFNFESYDFSPLPTAGSLAGVLPPWAYASLSKHATDRRSHLYTLEQFEAADTHDPLWNAAQLELVATGRIHNYLRMLWGKKVLEWTETPEEAYRILEQLNNKYAIDGRDPNSYTGILWCFGLFDRPWPPERQVFGSIRYMTSDSTAKKFKLAGYYNYIRRLPNI